jgi:hypothetical protein
MPDELHLSLWLRGFRDENMLEHFGEMLRVFPFSCLRPGLASLRVYALEYAEPPLLEHAFSGVPELETVVGMFQELGNADCAYIVEGWWDLWKYKETWQLTPSQVSLICMGPQFENDERDSLRIDFGPEDAFLPQPGVPESARAARSNLRSVLRLVEDLEEALPLERKNLWSESDENFAEHLESALDGEGL